VSTRGASMTRADQIAKRLAALIEFGTVNVLATRNRDEYGSYTVERGLFQGWRTQALVALRAIFEANHTYPEEFNAHTAEDYAANAEAGIAILTAARQDITNGYLTKTANLISAEVFSDFLQMAEHLLERDYKDPAASLCGAVLENGLRRIAGDHDVKVTDSDDLNSLRDKCAQKEVFNKMVRQQITSWTTLRNYADHGQFEQYTPQHVASMISDVRSFLAIYLG
jgi:hypothetical protein